MPGGEGMLVPATTQSLIRDVNPSEAKSTARAGEGMGFAEGSDWQPSKGCL